MTTEKMVERTTFLIKNFKLNVIFVHGKIFNSYALHTHKIKSSYPKFSVLLSKSSIINSFLVDPFPKRWVHTPVELYIASFYIYINDQNGPLFCAFLLL